MLDKFIYWVAESIINLILPSTLLKICLVGLIVSSFLSLWVGYSIIVMALVIVNIIYLVGEYLYAKSAEFEDDEQG